MGGINKGFRYRLHGGPRTKNSYILRREAQDYLRSWYNAKGQRIPAGEVIEELVRVANRLKLKRVLN